MKYSSEIVENILKISLEGDLIGEKDGIGLLDTVNDNLNESVLKCAIDLSGLRYMNSTGIGVLITILTKFRNKGGEVVLINPSEQIKKLLLITKLNAIFSIYDTFEEAQENIKV
jgi:anti-sigma B factor antagonist